MYFDGRIMNNMFHYTKISAKCSSARWSQYSKKSPETSQLKDILSISRTTIFNAAVVCLFFLSPISWKVPKTGTSNK